MQLKKVIMIGLSLICLVGCQQKTNIETSSKETEKKKQTSSLEVKKAEINNEATETSEFLYAKKDDGIVIRSYNGSDSEVIIPDEIDGLPVTEISEKAFSDNENITGVKIPTSVKFIGEDAFYQCDNLKIVDFGTENRESLELDDHAFYFDTNIEGSLIIKANTIKIGWQVFSGTHNVTDIALLCDELDLTDGPFSYCGAKSVFLKDSTTVKYTKRFSNSDEGNVFENMEKVEKIILPPSVNFISEYTFTGDSKVVVYAPEGSDTITNIEKQGIPTNTDDYVSEYSKFLDAYTALGY